MPRRDLLHLRQNGWRGTCQSKTASQLRLYIGTLDLSVPPRQGGQCPDYSFCRSTTDALPLDTRRAPLQRVTRLVVVQ